MIPPEGDWECVSLEDVILQLHLGIRDWERHPDRRQRLKVNVHCYRKLQSRPASIAECMDYSRIYRYLTTDWPARKHTDLLETLAHDLVDFLFQDETIDIVQVRLAKLDVYLDTAVPAFQITKHR